MAPPLAPSAPSARRRKPLLDAQALAASAAPGLSDQADADAVIAAMPGPRRKVMRQRQARAQGVSPGAEAAQAADARAIAEARARLQVQEAAPEEGEDAQGILERIAEAFGQSEAPAIGQASRARRGGGAAQSAPARALAEALAGGQADQRPVGPPALPLAISGPRLPQPLGQVRPRKGKLPRSARANLPAILSLLSQ